MCCDGLELKDAAGQMGLADDPSPEPLKEFIYRESDVFGYLSEQDWGYVPTSMEGYRRAASIGMAELLMGTPLSNLLETKSLKHSNDLFWLEDRRFGHG